jgi:hypothetical protein
MYGDTSVALRFERQDGAHGFDDPAVPAALTVEEVTERAAPRLRFPLHDVSTGKRLRYSMLHDGREIARDLPVGEVFPERRALVHIVSEYQNAAE